MHEVITQEYVNELIKGQAEGRQPVTIKQLKDIYTYAGKPDCVALYLKPNMYVRFESIPKLELFIKNLRGRDKLDFIETIRYTNASSAEMNYLGFLQYEFFQGKGVASLKRFCSILIPLLILNILISQYCTHHNLNNIFAGLLSSISIFVAIFSVFTVGQSYLSNKKLSLFKNGKLAQYFAVDKHMTSTGLGGIMLCIFGLTISADNTTAISYSLNKHNIQDLTVLLLLNLSFLSAYIVLRSIQEFYIGRPGSYSMAELKDEFFEQEIISK